MKILAIGATGFIGRHVVHQLVRSGHVVTILHRGETNPVLPERVEQILGHRDRLSDVVEDFRRFGPDVVLDMILFTERQAHELVNALRGVADRLVVVSSADVYRNYDGFRLKPTAQPDPAPLDEDAPLRETRYPYRGYGLSFEHADDYDKILVEQVVLDQPDLPATVLRLPAVYGPGDKGYRLRPYLQRMADVRPAILLADEQARWRWTRGYVGNVAAAIALAVTDGRAARCIYNVGENPTPTEREWVERIGAAAGGTVRWSRSRPTSCPRTYDSLSTGVMTYTRAPSVSEHNLGMPSPCLMKMRGNARSRGSDRICVKSIGRTTRRKMQFSIRGKRSNIALEPSAPMTTERAAAQRRR